MKTVIINNLEWQYEDDGIQRTWEEAQEYAASLGEGWRLPTYYELIQIVDINRRDQLCIPELRCRSAHYWSGSTHATDCYRTWSVSFDRGTVYWGFKLFHNYVRCVRDVAKGSQDD